MCILRTFTDINSKNYVYCSFFVCDLMQKKALFVHKTRLSETYFLRVFYPAVYFLSTSLKMSLSHSPSLMISFSFYLLWLSLTTSSVAFFIVANNIFVNFSWKWMYVSFGLKTLRNFEAAIKNNPYRGKKYEEFYSNRIMRKNQVLYTVGELCLL